MEAVAFASPFATLTAGNGGAIAVWSGGESLGVLDVAGVLETGGMNLVALGEPTATTSPSEFAFSPTGRRWAFTDLNSRALKAKGVGGQEVSIHGADSSRSAITIVPSL